MNWADWAIRETYGNIIHQNPSNTSITSGGTPACRPEMYQMNRRFLGCTHENHGYSWPIDVMRCHNICWCFFLWHTKIVSKDCFCVVGPVCLGPMWSIHEYPTLGHLLSAVDFCWGDLGSSSDHSWQSARSDSSLENALDENVSIGSTFYVWVFHPT